MSQARAAQPFSLWKTGVGLRAPKGVGRGAGLGEETQSEQRGWRAEGRKPKAINRQEKLVSGVNGIDVCVAFTVWTASVRSVSWTSELTKKRRPPCGPLRARAGSTTLGLLNGYGDSALLSRLLAFLQNLYQVYSHRGEEHMHSNRCLPARLCQHRIRACFGNAAMLFVLFQLPSHRCTSVYYCTCHPFLIPTSLSTTQGRSFQVRALAVLG